MRVQFRRQRLEGVDVKHALHCQPAPPEPTDKDVDQAQAALCDWLE